jgi:predicted flap endonuclease-1-like 5' DNA nuclease
MDDIKGLIISKLGFKPLKLGDFLFHEGPLVSHFVDSSNLKEHYLYKWCDSDALCNRWMIAKCSEDLLTDFLNNKITLRGIINANAFVYIMDLDDNLDEHNILIANTQDLPEAYLPTENSFFNEKQYEKYALQLKEALVTKKNTINIDRVLEELSNLKEQQHETNTLLNAILKKVFPTQVIQGQVAKGEMPYGKHLGNRVVEKPVYRETIVEREVIIEKRYDDLTRIEGIGPKIKDILNNSGIYTFEQLASATPEMIREILEKEGPRFSFHDPSTWAEQSILAAEGKWEELKKSQNKLYGGK